MAWEASVISKTMDSGGLVYVTIEYADGDNKLSETYHSNHPSDEWINNTVRSRLAQLKAASAFSLNTGKITLPAEPEVDPNIRLFRIRCGQLIIAKTLIDMGALQADNAKVVALVNWVKNNAAAYMDYL